MTLSYNEYLDELQKQYHFRYIALLENDQFHYLNSVLTAEGLLSFMISHSLNPIYQSHILVLGNGQCAKEIITLLNSFNCDIDVGCRKFKDDFNKQIYLDQINYNKYDYIINTIPYRVINDKAINDINKDSKIFDIASYPYGLDHGYALSQNIQTYIIPSIPTMYAYEYGALIMKNTMEEYL